MRVDRGAASLMEAVGATRTAGAGSERGTRRLVRQQYYANFSRCDVCMNAFYNMQLWGGWWRWGASSRIGSKYRFKTGLQHKNVDRV
jgi:hypothetical protein